MATDQLQTMEGPEIEPIKAAEAGISPEEIWLEVRNENFVRAAHLAVNGGLPDKVIRQLQCSAVKHFIEVLHNFEGAKILIASYTLSSDEIRSMLKSIMDDPRSQSDKRTWFNGRGRMVAGSLSERIATDPMFREFLKNRG